MGGVEGFKGGGWADMRVGFWELDNRSIDGY